VAALACSGTQLRRGTVLATTAQSAASSFASSPDFGGVVFCWVRCFACVVCVVVVFASIRYVPMLLLI